MSYGACLWCEKPFSKDMSHPNRQFCNPRCNRKYSYYKIPKFWHREEKRTLKDLRDAEVDRMQGKSNSLLKCIRNIKKIEAADPTTLKKNLQRAIKKILPKESEGTRWFTLSRSSDIFHNSSLEAYRELIQLNETSKNIKRA